MLNLALTDRLTQQLTERRQNGLIRQLRTADGLTDFCSNDYLGLARSADLWQAIRIADAHEQPPRNGATGSRLLAGQTPLADAVETELAQHYRAEAALLFNSGYDANVGLLSCVPQPGDTLLTDELIHASMIDGARLCKAHRQRFRHNDLQQLEALLQQAVGQTFVAVESVYSMDGDHAPLAALCDLCDRYQAALVVDEAHATGVYGPHGEGVTVALGLENRVWARVHTFGKGLGVHGAAVVGSGALRDYLINFARSFIYTTALPPHSLLAIREAHRYSRSHPYAREQLQQLIRYFQERIATHLSDSVWTNSPSAIQCLLVPGNAAARRIAHKCQQAGLDVRAILSPTVPVGQERIRICLHAFNTIDDVNRLVENLNS